MVITVSSIKDGAGKSSVVILLANNLASRGHKVPVIDMDLNNSSTLYYTAGLKDAESMKCVSLSFFMRFCDKRICMNRAIIGNALFVDLRKFS